MAEATAVNSAPSAGATEPPTLFPSAILDSPDVQAFLSEAAQELVEEAGAARGFAWAITLVGPGQIRNWASGSSKAREIDAVQSSFADGPAQSAVASREFAHIPDTALDRRWSGYSAAVGRQGVGSVLSVPLIVEWEVSAVLTLYAASPHAFTSDDVVHAVECARRMSKACQLLLELGRKAGAAITQSPLIVIEFAVWSLIRQYGLNKESAMQNLHTAVRGLPISSPPAPASAT
jgi:GAF domain-containing protein